MGIVDEDIARVREAADIVAVISGHTQLKRVGTRWMGCCPFHNEKTPSFSVNQAEGLYYCFGCQVRGDVITFVRDIDKLDFVGAVEWLANRFGVQLRYTERDEGEQRKRQAKRFAMMERAVDFYHDRLLNGPDAGRARGYLRSRGFDRDMVEQFRLGWAPDDWDQLVKHLGAPRDDLVDCGLAFVNRRDRLQDFFRARVLFPIFDDQGRPIAFGGRKLPDADGAKYQNSRENLLYHKSSTLYALHWAKADMVASGEAVVCEGYTDVIGFFRAGIPRAVATCGTALTEDHIKRLKRFTNRVVLAYDADEAGQNAAERVYEWERRYDMEIAVLSLPPGTDPDELSQSDPDALAGAVTHAKPFLGFRVDRVLHHANLTTPEGRAKAASAALDVIREHPDPLVRDQYLMEVAGACRVQPDQLRDELRRAPRRQPAAPADEPPPWEGSAGSPEPQRYASIGTESVDVEALRHLIAQPALIADRLLPVLFRPGLARAAYNELAQASLVDALESAPAQVADFLARLAAGPGPTSEVPDVLVGLAVDATRRAVSALEAQARRSEDPLGYAPTIAGLKLMLEDLLGDEPSMDSLDRLLAWLSEHAESIAC